jgi:hypothetical protein
MSRTTIGSSTVVFGHLLATALEPQSNSLQTYLGFMGTRKLFLQLIGENIDHVIITSHVVKDTGTNNQALRKKLQDVFPEPTAMSSTVSKLFIASTQRDDVHATFYNPVEGELSPPTSVASLPSSLDRTGQSTLPNSPSHLLTSR